MKPLTTDRVFEIMLGLHDPFDSELRRMCEEILVARGIDLEAGTAKGTAIHPSAVVPFTGGPHLRDRRNDE